MTNLGKRNVLRWVGTTLCAGTGITLGGCLSDDEPQPDHGIFVDNERETSHDIRIETIVDGDRETYGPRTVEGRETWSVTRFERAGELTVRVRVDDELAWTDTHQIPTLDDSRRSAVEILLRRTGAVIGGIMREESA